MTPKIRSDGTKHWFNRVGQLHRVGGPAAEWPFDSKGWYISGDLHRLDGPAIEYNNGHKEWWVMGKRLTKERFDQHPLVIFYRLCRAAL